MAARDADGRGRDRRGVRRGRRDPARAAVAVCGYSIETPRLLLNSTTRRQPTDWETDTIRSGRYVMVQGALAGGRPLPRDAGMYKAPPPEISSEQFYETDTRRGFRRGFSIQTVGPLPIGWAEHVLADGHWGHALREYMRDYNHWVRSAGCASCCRTRTTGSRWRTRSTTTACRSHGWTTPCTTTTRRTSPTPRSSSGGGRSPERQDIIAIDRYAHLIGGKRMGTRRKRASATPITDLGHPEPVCRRWQRLPTQGSESGPHHHGGVRGWASGWGAVRCPAGSRRRSRSRRKRGPSCSGRPRERQGGETHD